jgi:hypothetical protein
MGRRPGLQFGLLLSLFVGPLPPVNIFSLIIFLHPNKLRKILDDPTKLLEYCSRQQRMKETYRSLSSGHDGQPFAMESAVFGKNFSRLSDRQKYFAHSSRVGLSECKIKGRSRSPVNFLLRYFKSVSESVVGDLPRCREGQPRAVQSSATFHLGRWPNCSVSGTSLLVRILGDYASTQLYHGGVGGIGSSSTKVVQIRRLGR